MGKTSLNFIYILNILFSELRYSRYMYLCLYDPNLLPTFSNLLKAQFITLLSLLGTVFNDMQLSLIILQLNLSVISTATLTTAIDSHNFSMCMKVWGSRFMNFQPMAY